MKIGGTSDVNGPQRIPPRLGLDGPDQVQQQAVSQPAGDRVEISDAARLSQVMSAVPDIRVDKVAAAKQAIANGQLDTPEHLNVAVDRLLQDFFAA